MTEFDKIYYKILHNLWNYGIESSPRKIKIKELLGYRFVLHDPLDNLITLKGFETNEDYAKEEFKWYVSGSNKISDLGKYAKTWEKFSDDGVHVNSAYGERIFGKHPQISINQWEWVKQKLKTDPDSRQAIINLNAAFDKERETKDFPCTVFLQYFIREDELHAITAIRSNDVYCGLRNDVPCFSWMQQKMADELKVGIGDYIHFAGSMHLYENQWEKAKKLLEEGGDLDAE